MKNNLLHVFYSILDPFLEEDEADNVSIKIILESIF